MFSVAPNSVYSSNASIMNGHYQQPSMAPYADVSSPTYASSALSQLLQDPYPPQSIMSPTSTPQQTSQPLPPPQPLQQQQQPPPQQQQQQVPLQPNVCIGNESTAMQLGTDNGEQSGQTGSMTLSSRSIDPSILEELLRD